MRKLGFEHLDVHRGNVLVGSVDGEQSFSQSLIGGVIWPVHAIFPFHCRPKEVIHHVE
jgi:hypothetical protein